MALSPNISSFLFLLTLLSSHIHARESQFFNKIPSNTNNVDTLKEAQIIPQNQEDPLNKPNQEPNFIPENTDDGFGHESGQLPPSTTTTNTNLPYDNQPNEFLPKYLPKNYNTESYVTEPEGYHQVQDTNNNYNNDANAYQKQSYPTTSTKTTNLPYNNEPNSFLPKYLPKNYNTESYVTEPEGYHPVQETNNNNNNYNNNDINEYQKQSYPTTTATNTNLPYNNEPNSKYLPKNYNTESYVTEPEGYHPVQETNNNNNYNNDVDTYQKEAYPATSTTTTSGSNYYANGNTYNGQGQGVNEFKLGQKSYGTNAVERQGMSDTRYLENGKYYYDLNLEKNQRYPFKSIGGFGDQNENSYDLNKYSDDGFENQGEQFQDFQDEQNLP